MDKRSFLFGVGVKRSFKRNQSFLNMDVFKMQEGQEPAGDGQPTQPTQPTEDQQPTEGDSQK